MIHTDSHPAKYQTLFSNGEQVSVADTTPDKGGGNLGFRPHELLEAALASCMNISLRMCAEKYAIPLAGVSVSVSLDRSDPNAPLFKYSVQFQGEITAPQQEHLLAALANCPVRTTLAKQLQFTLCNP